MTLASIGSVLVAPPPSVSGGFHSPTTVIVIVLVIAVVGGLAILGWRSPDRSPGADSKAERDRVDD